MGIAGIVRPFETPKVTPAPVASSATPASEKNTIILCGENASPTTFSGSYSLDISYYKVKRPKEMSEE